MDEVIKLFLENYDKYKQVFLKKCKDSYTAEEAMQNLYLKLIKSKDVVTHPKTYLYNAINYFSMRALNYERRYINRLANDAELDIENEVITNKTPFDILYQKQLRDGVQKFTDTNLVRDKILRRHILNQETLHEIALDMKIDGENCRSHIKVAKFNGNLDKLKEYL